MKAKMSFIVGAVILTVASVSAQAQVPITGQINFTGGATVDNAIPNATTFEKFFGPSGSGGPVVAAGGGLPSGAYAGVPGNTVANFNAPFVFAPSFTGPFGLWSFTFGGETYSFQVNAVTGDQQFTSPFNYIDISGTGTGTITGGNTDYLPTTENWSITGTTTAGNLTINIGDSNVAVPEPSTFAFAGLGGLFSIATLIRRK